MEKTAIDLSEIKEVCTPFSSTDANLYLKAGWVLLETYLQWDGITKNGTEPRFVLGWRGDGEPARPGQQQSNGLSWVNEETSTT